MYGSGFVGGDADARAGAGVRGHCIWGTGRPSHDSCPMATLAQEKTDVGVAPPTAALAQACEAARALAWAAGEAERGAGLDVLPEERAAGALRFGLVEVRAQVVGFSGL